MEAIRQRVPGDARLQCGVPRDALGGEAEGAGEGACRQPRHGEAEAHGQQRGAPSRPSRLASRSGRRSVSRYIAALIASRPIAQTLRLRLVLDDDARQTLADQLLALSMPEFVDVLHRVLPAHAGSGYGQKTSLVLAEVVRQVDPPGIPEGLLVAAVAWPDRGYYEGSFGSSDLFENGICPECGIEVVSTAKRAACPVCGASCSLT
jgi:hypothetical protein